MQTNSEWGCVCILSFRSFSSYTTVKCLFVNHICFPARLLPNVRSPKKHRMAVETEDYQRDNENQITITVKIMDRLSHLITAVWIASTQMENNDSIKAMLLKVPSLSKSIIQIRSWENLTEIHCTSFGYGSIMVHWAIKSNHRLVKYCRWRLIPISI